MDKKKKTNQSSRRQVQSIHSNYADKNKEEESSRGSHTKPNYSRSVLDDDSDDLTKYIQKLRLTEDNSEESELRPSESSENHDRPKPASEKTTSKSKDKNANHLKTQPLRVKEPIPDTKNETSRSASNQRKNQEESNEQDSNVLKSSKSEINLVNPTQEESSKEQEPEKESSPPKEQPEEQYFHHVSYGEFRVLHINGDGNCLFRCMAHYVFGNEDDHILVRHIVVYHICGRWDYYKSFATDEDVEKYCQRMLENGTYGSEMEISSFVEVFTCIVKVFFMATPRRDPLVFGSHGTSCYFMYRGENDCGHYDVLRPLDPEHLQFHTDKVMQLRKQVAEKFEHAWNEEVSEDVAWNNEAESNMSFNEILAFLKDLVDKKASPE